MSDNTPVIPQEWITAKTIKTISGAALSCWLITLFFDLICFMPITNYGLHYLLVLIMSIISTLGFAINRVITSSSNNKKGLWLLVIPNAMLIYIHALGFQAATKELAIRANANEQKKEESQAAIKKAGVGNIFNFLTKQTSWIPSLELTNKTKEFESDQKILLEANKVLRDSIVNLSNRSGDPSSSSNDQDLYTVKQELKSLSDSISYYDKQYRKCIANNISLKSEMDLMASNAKKSTDNYKLLQEQNARPGTGDAILLRRMEEKNALIRKWNAVMQDLKMPRADMERVMNGYMGDENYYRQLFRPMPTIIQ